MRPQWWGLLVGVVCALATAGCQSKADYMPGWVPIRGSLSRLDTPSVIQLYARSDPKLEQAITGGRDARIVILAQDELADRFKRNDHDWLSETERNQLNEAIRGNLASLSNIDCLWGFSVDAAPEEVLWVMGRSEEVAARCPPAIWKALYARYPRETVQVLIVVAQTSDGVNLAGMLENVGDAGIRDAAGLLFGYTWHQEWTVRAGAMLGLNKLKDERVSEALGRNARDLAKGPDVLTAVCAPLHASVRRVYQRELLRAVGENKVEAAEDVLASMVLDWWAGEADDSRAYAGQALAAVNRDRALALTRELLGRWSGTERSVGATTAGYAGLTELRDELERMAEKDSSKNVREAAQEALGYLKSPS